MKLIRKKNRIPVPAGNTWSIALFQSVIYQSWEIVVRKDIRKTKSPHTDIS